MIDPGMSTWFQVTPDTSTSDDYKTDVVFQALKLAATLACDVTNEVVLFRH